MPKQLPAEDNPKYAATHLEGFMEKQSHDNAKKFQRRWFCLVNQWLAYAQAKNGPLDAKKAVDVGDTESIFLSSLRIVNLKGNDGRTLKLRAADPEEARMWVKQLSARKRELTSLSTEDRIKAANERVQAKGGGKPFHNIYASHSKTSSKGARIKTSESNVQIAQQSTLSVKEKLAAMEARMEKKLRERGLTPKGNSGSAKISRFHTHSSTTSPAISFGGGGSALSPAPATAPKIRQQYSTPARMQSDPHLVASLESNPFGVVEESNPDEPHKTTYKPSTEMDAFEDLPYAEQAGDAAMPTLTQTNSDLHLLDSLPPADLASDSDDDDANPFADDDGDADSVGSNPFEEPSDTAAPAVASAPAPVSQRIGRRAPIDGSGADDAGGNPFANTFEAAVAQPASVPEQRSSAKIATQTSNNPFDDADISEDVSHPSTPGEPQNWRDSMEAEQPLNPFGGAEAAEAASANPFDEAGAATEPAPAEPAAVDDDDGGNPFGFSDNPFGDADSDEEERIARTGNPFGDDDNEDDVLPPRRTSNPFGDDDDSKDAASNGTSSRSRPRPVSVKIKSRALAKMRGWMVKYPLQYEGKAMPLGMRQKRFFVLSGNSLCYYDKLCNSEGLSTDGTRANLLGMVFISDSAMPEGKRCKVKAKGPRGIHVTAHFGEVAYLKLEAEGTRVRDMWVGAMTEVLEREREIERQRDDNPFS